MSQKRFLQVADFDKTQMYKDRNPIWIKLHCSILDDYEFSALPDQTKFHALGLMILAARLNNKFPDDERWLRLKIGANSEINLKVLLEIRFLEVFREAKTAAKNTNNTRKSNKIKGKFVKQSEKLGEPEQNRTEEKKTDHTTTQQSERAENGADAKNRVVVGDFSKSSETENQNENERRGDFNKSDSAVAGGGHLSRFTLEDCLKYALASDGVKNPNALANSLYQTGNADAFIMAMLYPRDALAAERETFGMPTDFTNEPCAVCFGAKMADTDGKGYRKCVRCKDERGKSTGFEPQRE